jgi:phasin family protein
MQKEFIDNVNKAGKQAYDAAKEVTALNASTFETLLEKQLEITNQFVALSSKQAQILSEVKDAPSAFQAQTALFKEISEQAAGNARDAVEILNKTRAAYDKLFQKGLKEATSAAEKAQASFNQAA